MNIYLKIYILITLLSFTTYSANVESTQLQVQSQIENVVWCGNDRVQDEDDETIVLEGFDTRITDILFMQTFNGEVYISNNHGQQWANFTESIVKQFGSKLNKNFKIDSIKVSPADTKQVFLFGNNGQSFVSQNCGKKLALLTHDKNLHDFKLNRMDKNLLLAHKQVSCKKFDDECDVGERSLYLSKDMGRSFNQIVEHVNFGTWDKNNHEDDVHNHRILVHQRIYVKGKNNDKQLLTFSDDFFQTSKQIDNTVQHFFQTPHFLFVLTDSDMDDSYNLKVAVKETEDYLQYKTHDINLPIKRNKDHSFTVLDTNEGQVFLGINHQGHSSLMTNIYYSDSKGINYTLGLLNAVRDDQGNVDYEKIKSNQGTYIANIYDKEELERVQNQKQKKQNSEKTYSKQGGYSETKNLDNSKFNSLQSIKKSKISFNRGSTWHPIKAPRKTFDKKELRCSGECSLHLVGRTESYGEPIYSSENAHGIILGTGNTGLYLEEKEQNMNTYLSNDGGHTWHEIRQHPHLYEIGDRGGIIVIARSNAVTNQIHYSWNLGQDWQAYKFAEKPMTVISILSEQSNMGQKFLVFGRRQSKTENKVTGIVISIDFSTLHQRVCEMESEPENPDSDYEFWQPKNFNMDECILGQQIRYVRRKQSSQCLNPISNDQYQFIDSCECTNEDFECDFGFYRNEQDECVPMNKKYVIEEDYPVPEKCNNVYYIPTGYKKINASKCVNGVNLGPIKKQCPAKEAKQSTTTRLIDEDTQKNPKINNTNNQNEQIEENHNGFIQKYGYIIIILGLSYYFKEQIKLYLAKIYIYATQFIPGSDYSQMQSNNKGYGSIDNSGGERLGLVDDDDEELQN